MVTSQSSRMIMVMAGGIQENQKGGTTMIGKKIGDSKNNKRIPTVDVCFDADRLDLGRVGIAPNPKLMATEQGAFYAANIHLIDAL